METILLFIAAAGAGMQAIIGLSFFISCVCEKEPRATVYSGIQFLLMLGLVMLLFYLNTIGFFETNSGLTFLIIGLALAGGLCFFLMRKTESNPRALDGTKGLILGEVPPTDERDTVFARNRTLRPGSEEYKTYYEMRPEFENSDAARREKGGPLGHPGAIDRPHDRPNVAATLASLSIPLHLSQPEKFNPPAHPAFKGQRVELNPGSASTRVKGYTLGIGANLVGICEINPLWVYSHRGEVFNENWADWGRKLELTHKYAVVFATEMAFERVGTAPHSAKPTAIMGNYAQGAFFATQVAALESNL